MSRRKLSWPGSRLLPIIVVGSIALAACGTGKRVESGGNGSIQELESMTLTIANYGPDRGLSKLLSDYVTERTDRKITFDIYENSSLAPAGEMLNAVSSGLADIGYLTAAAQPQELPLTDQFSVLGSLPSNSFPAGIMQAAAAQQETFTGYKPLVDEYRSNNLKFLTAQYIGTSYDMMCTKQIDNAADARGLRVRTPGSIWEREAKALGMVPVNLPATELYQGLQRGVVDCVILAPTGYHALGLSEVAKHYYPTVFTTYMSNPVVMNLDLWNSLPREVKKIFQDASHRLWAGFLEKFIADHETFANDIEKNNVTVHDTRAMDQILRSYQEGIIAQFRDDSEKSAMYDKFAGSLDRWSKVITQLGYKIDENPVRTPESIMKSYRDANTVELEPFINKVGKELFNTVR